MNGRSLDLFALLAGLFWAASTTIAAPADTANFIARSFPEKVGPFARVEVTTNDAAIQGDVMGTATAKYVSGATTIEWTGTQFAAPDQAFAALETMIKSHEGEGVGISSVKNVEGKIRYAVIETPEGITCCWVNKQRQNFFFVATGKQPEIETFMRLQNTW